MRRCGEPAASGFAASSHRYFTGREGAAGSKPGRKETTMSDEQRTDVALEGRFGRRTLLRGSLLGGAGLAAAALIGCGGDEEPEQTTSAATGGAAAPTGNGPGKLVQDAE
jgi:hypothetical protein